MRKSEVDLKRYNEGAGLPQTYTDGSVGWHLPYDVPAYGKVFRLLGPATPTESGKPVEGLKGWVVELDAYTFGVKVLVRIGMDGTMKLYVEDGDGMTKMEEWQK